MDRYHGAFVTVVNSAASIWILPFDSHARPFGRVMVTSLPANCTVTIVYLRYPPSIEDSGASKQCYSYEVVVNTLPIASLNSSN